MIDKMIQTVHLLPINPNDGSRLVAVGLSSDDQQNKQTSIAKGMLQLYKITLIDNKWTFVEVAMPSAMPAPVSSITPVAFNELIVASG